MIPSCAVGVHTAYTRTLFAVTISMLLLFLASQPLAAQTPTPQAEEEPALATEADFDASAVPMPNLQPNALLGESIYLDNCAPCHGQLGNSDGPVVADLPNPPPLFSDPATVHAKSPAEYFYTTKFGRIENLMPPWGNRLSDEEIWNVAAYAWHLHTSQEEVEGGQAVLEQAAEANLDLLDALEASFSSPSSLFSSQDGLSEELSSSYPQVTTSLSTADLASVTGYLRTLTMIPPWGATYQAGDGVIEGKVQPAVPSVPLSGSLSGLLVTLNAFIQFEQVSTFEAVTDADGAFRFEGLSSRPNVLYLLETDYLDVPYRSDVIDFSRLDTEVADGASATESAPSKVNVSLPVYETTEETEKIFYDRVNWVVDYAPGEIIVGQILSIGNLGERTVVGRLVDGAERAVTIELPLPPGANSIQFQSGTLGERFLQSGNVVYDTAPVIPGESTQQIFMSYRLPVENNSIQFEQPFRYPLGTLNLLVADIPGLDAQAVGQNQAEGEQETADSGLTFIGAESVQDIPYLYWQGLELPPQTFTLDLAGLIAAGEMDPRGDQGGTEPAGAANLSGAAMVRTSPVMEPIIPIAVGGAMLFLLVGISLWPLSRLRKIPQADSLALTKDRLIQEIARLDDLHEKDLLDSQQWQQERSELKARLFTVARQMQDL